MKNRTRATTFFTEGFLVGGIVAVVPALVFDFESARTAAAFIVCTAVCVGMVAAVARPSALEKLASYVVTIFNP